MNKLKQEWHKIWHELTLNEKLTITLGPTLGAIAIGAFVYFASDAAYERTHASERNSVQRVVMKQATSPCPN